MATTHDAISELSPTMLGELQALGQTSPALAR